MTDSGKKFDRFIEIVRDLRSENGCPWDKRQTPLTLKRYLEEEAHELLDAIDASDHQHIKEELGDLLYLIILLTQIHSEKNLFTIADVIDSISTKMVRRHPHVFNDEKIESEAQLRQKWLEIKESEKTTRSNNKKN